MTIVAALEENGDSKFFTKQQRKELLGPGGLAAYKNQGHEKHGPGKDGIDFMAKFVLGKIKEKFPLNDIIETLQDRYKGYEEVVRAGNVSPRYGGIVRHGLEEVMDPSTVWEELLDEVARLEQSRDEKDKKNKQFFWQTNKTSERDSKLPLDPEKAAKNALKKLKAEIARGRENRVNDRNDTEVENFDPRAEAQKAKKSQAITIEAKTVKRAQKGTAQIWWKKWWYGNVGAKDDRSSIWFKNFDQYSRIYSICAFFQSFTADAYVASANRQDNSHPHPHEETCAGLACALHRDNRKATLYITNPWCFKKEFWKGFEEALFLVRLTPDMVMNRNLFVRYPHTKHFMSLTANPKLVRPEGVVSRDGNATSGTFKLTRPNQTTCYPEGLHDLNNSTESIPLLGKPDEPITEAFYKLAEERNRRMESQSAWTALEALQSKIAIMFKIAPEGQTAGNCYLVLDADGFPIVEQHPGGVSLKVLEGWTGAGVEVSNALLLSRTANSDENCVIHVYSAGTKTAPAFEIRWAQKEQPTDPTETLMSFYARPNNVPVRRAYNKDDKTVIKFSFTAVEPENVVLVNNAIMNHMVAQSAMPILTTSFATMALENESPLTERIQISNVETGSDVERRLSTVNRESFYDAGSEDESDFKIEAADNELAVRNATDHDVLDDSEFFTPMAAVAVAAHNPKSSSNDDRDDSQTLASGGDLEDGKEVESYVDGTLDLHSSPNTDAVVKSGTGNDFISVQSSFMSFLVAARLKQTDIRTGGSALISILFQGSDTKLSDLGMTGSHEVQLLSYDVDYSDPQKSWISFTDDGIDVTANSTLLQLKVPEGAKASFTGTGGTEADIIDARVLLESGVDGTVRVALLATTMTVGVDRKGKKDRRLDSYTELRVVKVLSGIEGPSLLIKALSGMKVPDMKLARLTVLETLAIVLASDEAAIQMFFDGLPIELAALEGFADLRPDWCSSTAEAEYSATKRVNISHARIVFDLQGQTIPESGNPETKPILASTGFDSGGFAVKLKEAYIDIQNPRLANENVVFSATVGFSAPGGSEIELQMAVAPAPTTEGTVDACFYVGGTRVKSLDDLTGILLGGETASKKMDNVTVPFSNDGATTDKKGVTLDKLPLSPGSFGFVLQQQPREFAAGKVRLTRIFASAELTGWKDILPEGFPSLDFIKNVDVQVDVLNPLDDEMRRVRVDVGFDLELSVSKKDVHATLSAIPLAYRGDYEYRIDIDAESMGLSLAEITSAIGLGQVVSNVSEEVPFLKNLLEGVFVRHLSMGLVEEGGKWSFGDWSIRVWLPQLEMVCGVVFSNVNITLQDFGSSLEVFVSATIILGDPPVVMYLDVKSPTTLTGGELRVEIPNGLSVQKLLDAFKLGKFDDIPLVGQILNTELVRVAVSTTPSEQSEPVSIDGFEIQLHHPLINIGPMQFIDVSFEFSMSYPREGNHSHKYVKLGAFILDGDISATVEYLSAENYLRAALEPVQMVTIGKILEACLPASLVPGVAALKPVLDDLQLRVSNVEFFTEDGLDIRHLELHVKDDTPIEVQRFVLQEVRVVYDVSEAKEVAKNDTKLALKNGDSAQEDTKLHPQPETKTFKTFDLLAVIKKGSVAAKIAIRSDSEPDTDKKSLAFSIEPALKDGLKIRGILGLFGWKDDEVDLAEPGLRPSPLDISIDVIKGVMAKEGDQDEGNKDEGDQDEGGDKAGTPKSDPKSKAPKKMTLQSFQTTAHVDRRSTIHLEATDIELLDLRADFAFDAKLVKPAVPGKSAAVSGVSGILYGKLRIGKLFLELAYISQINKDSGISEQVFFAQADIAELLKKEYNAAAQAESKPDAPAGIDLFALAEASSMKSIEIDLPSAPESGTGKMPKLTIVSPNTIGARIRLKPTDRVEIWATGNNVYSGTVCGLDIELQNLTAFFRYTQGAFKDGTQNRHPNVHEAYLRGKVEFKGYVSAEAQLSIGKKKNAVFTALLGRDSGGGINVFEQVVDDLATSQSSSNPPVKSIVDGNTWNDMVPAFKEQMSFGEKSKLFLYANFKSKRVLLSATVEGFGNALLLGKDADAEAALKTPPSPHGNEVKDAQGM